MATINYRQTYSWTMAIELGRSMVRVIDQLPDDEKPALGQQLQTALTELPVAVGQDLIQGGQNRQAAVVRLYGLLDLIESIYPALDLTPATTALGELNERLMGDQFSEEILVAPVPVAETQEQEEAPAADVPSGDEAEAAEEQPSSV